MNVRAVQSVIILSWRLAIVQFKLRNEGSYLGILWYALHPLLLFCILYLVFFERLGDSIPLYPAYLMIGILMYNFFMRTTLDSTNAIVKSYFIKSFTFHREALVLSVVLKHLLSHLFEVVVFFSILIFFDIHFVGFFIYILFLPLFALFIYGIALLLSAVTIYFVDLANVWQFFVTLLWFVTPIFYAIEEHAILQSINQFNPLYYFLTVARDSIMYLKIPEVHMLVGLTVFTLLSMLAGTYVFATFKSKFAEMI